MTVIERATVTDDLLRRARTTMGNTEQPARKADGTVGGLIKRLRLERDWTQLQLAARVGASTGSVSRWENNHVRPDRRDARALADVLGVPVEDVGGRPDDTLATQADLAEIQREVDELRRKTERLEGLVEPDQEPGRSPEETG